MQRTVPGPVRWATVLWAAAVACGVTETALALAGMLASGGAVPWTGLLVRVAVYTSAALVVVWFARGHRWARVALVAGLGVVGGLGTLVAPVVLAALEGGGVLAAMGHGSHGLVYLMVRITHITTVAAAAAATFTPCANRYFAGNAVPERASG